MTASERMEMLVLLGAAMCLVNNATFPNDSYQEMAKDFLEEYERFRDA